jgi:hypothetical protein
VALGFPLFAFKHPAQYAENRYCALRPLAFKHPAQYAETDIAPYGPEKIQA